MIINMASLPSAAAYYTQIKSKWASDYPSSEDIESIWGFYNECGYDDPQSTLKSMLDPITPLKKKRILDYGCDKGLMLDFFCKALDADTKGYGVDINDEAIKTAKRRFPRFSFQVGDGLTIPYDDKYFDVVLVMATMKHVRYEDRDAIYAEINRVADHALVIEADEKEQNVQEMMGWKFYNSNFAEEFDKNFDACVKVVREGGDILGLYKCK
mmetsp:Transcript_25659/g.54008  ORF Transcript_25659/g.54008 Transcript_25659/m.54008 type:complete len:212 (-) Transcript_25659:179-814(-)